MNSKPPPRPGSQAPSAMNRPGSAARPGGAPGGPARPGGAPGGPAKSGMLPRGTAVPGKPVAEEKGPPGGRPPWYKRKYLVYPKFQMTLILVNSAVTIVLFGFTSLLVVRSHIYLESLVRQTRLPAQNLFSQLLTQQLRSLLVYMGIAVFVGVFTMGVTALMLSHKMAGPMIRMRNFFNNIAKNGDFPENLTFRDGDFFQDLPPSVNSAITALKKKWHR